MRRQKSDRANATSRRVKLSTDTEQLLMAESMLYQISPSDLAEAATRAALNMDNPSREEWHNLARAIAAKRDADKK